MNADRHVHLGRAVSQQNWLKALWHYRRALEFDPHHTEARLECAELYYRMDKPDLALEAIDVILERLPDHPDALFARANVLLSRDEARPALKLYQKVQQIVPNPSPEIHYNIALCLRKLGNNVKSLEAVERVFEEGFGFEDAWDLAGRLYLDLGRPEEAAAAFGQIIEFDANDVDAHHMRGIALARLTRWEEARAEWEAARSLDPEWDEPYRELGWVAHLQGETNRAEELLRKGLELNPENIQARIDLGAVLISRKHYKEAASELRRARESEPDNPVVETMLRELSAFERTP